jgi:hypothetical protein
MLEPSDDEDDDMEDGMEDIEDIPIIRRNSIVNGSDIEA